MKREEKVRRALQEREREREREVQTLNSVLMIVRGRCIVMIVQNEMMMAHSGAWWCAVAHGCMVVHGGAWCCMVAHGGAWWCTVMDDGA